MSSAILVFNDLFAGGHKEVLLYLLKHNPQLVNCQDQSFMTPLHYAAESGNTEVVELLCDHNASLKETNQEGRTPLHLACHNLDIPTIKMLLHKGASLELVDGFGYTPLELLAVTGINNNNSNNNNNNNNNNNSLLF